MLLSSRIYDVIKGQMLIPVLMVLVSLLLGLVGIYYPSLPTTLLSAIANVIILFIGSIVLLRRQEQEAVLEEAKSIEKLVAEFQDILDGNMNTSLSNIIRQFRSYLSSSRGNEIMQKCERREEINRKLESLEGREIVTHTWLRFTSNRIRNFVRIKQKDKFELDNLGSEFVRILHYYSEFTETFIDLTTILGGTSEEVRKNYSEFKTRFNEIVSKFEGYSKENIMRAKDITI